MPRFASYFLILVFACAKLQDAYALGGHDDTPEQDYIDYAVNNPELQSTGYLFGLNNGTPEGFASAVFLDDGGSPGTHWVLTAGHVLDEGIFGPIYEQFLVGTGSNTTTDFGEFQYAAEYFLHPDYAGAEDGVDLALLYFDTPFLSAEEASIYTGEVLAGEKLSLAGFGSYGTPDAGLTSGSNGQRRGGEAIVEFIDSPASGYVEYFYRSDNHPNYLPIGVQGVQGDSGGGAYLNGLLAGIGSGGGSDVFYGSATSYYLVAEQLPWINETIASKVVPEPASATLLLIGGAVAGMLRGQKD